MQKSYKGIKIVEREDCPKDKIYLMGGKFIKSPWQKPVDKLDKICKFGI